MHSFASVSRVFTAETCTFGTFHMYTKIHMYYIFYMKCTVLLLFSCVFTAETCTFGTFQMYTKIHMKHIFYMKCTVKLVFSYVFFLCFHCKHMYFWCILHVYKNTHVPYILHQMHSFASVFMCFHCVFTVETRTFGTFHMYTKIHMCHILYMK
jgi:hypothetical protein